MPRTHKNKHKTSKRSKHHHSAQFDAIEHLIELLHSHGMDSHQTITELLTTGESGRLFFDFPVCESHNGKDCIDRLFANPEWLSEFEERLMTWQPRNSKDGIQAFVEKFMAYFSEPFEENPHWLSIFEDQLDSKSLAENECYRQVQTAILFKLQATWFKTFPEKAPEIPERLRCFSEWNNSYPSQNFNDRMALFVARSIQNTLQGFTRNLKSPEVDDGSRPVKKFDVGLDFRQLIRDIRTTLIFQSHIDSELIFHNEVKNYLDGLQQDKQIKKEQFIKVRTAVLADKRLSIDPSQMPNFSLRSPKESLLYLKGNKAEESERRQLYRTYSEHQLKLDQEKRDPQSPPRFRRSSTSRNVLKRRQSEQHIHFKLDKPMKDNSAPPPQISPETSRKLSSSRLLFFRRGNKETEQLPLNEHSNTLEP